MNTTRTLLAAAALGITTLSAHAAPGVSVTTAQEHAVHAGMTEAEVRATLGQPQRVFHFASQDGPTWAYTAPQLADGPATFNVDFGADGRVAAAAEQVDGDD